MVTNPQPTPPAALSAGDQLPPVDPAVSRMNADLARKDQEIRALRDRLTVQSTYQPPAPAPAPVAPIGAPPAAQMKDLNTEFLKNPVQSAATIAQAVANQYVQAMSDPTKQASYDTQVEMARQLARGRNPETFDRYVGEIDGKMMTVDPQWRTNSTMWQRAFDQVKGEHFDDEVRRLKDEKNQAPAVHVSRDGGPASPSPRPGPAPKAAELSAEEREVAKGFGITAEAYAEARDRIDRADPKGRPDRPSAFDGFITFSSEEKRRAAREQRKRQAAAGTSK